MALRKLRDFLFYCKERGDNMIFAMENSVYQLGCDDDNDIANLPDFAKSNNIKPGTACYKVHGGKVYIMDSKGEWVIQN